MKLRRITPQQSSNTTMKEFTIKNKWLDIDSDNFNIQHDGVDVYQVKGNGFNPGGSQASFQTMDGKELAFLQQERNPKKKNVPWKTFEWIKDGKVWAHAHQEKSYWGFFEKKLLAIDIPGENDYKLTGDRLAMKFEVFKGSEKCGEIEKKWSLVDTYHVSVVDGADEIDMLLCGILINYIYHSHNDNTRQPPKFDRHSIDRGKRTSAGARLSVGAKK